jgi:hypothetical protein
MLPPTVKKLDHSRNFTRRKQSPQAKKPTGVDFFGFIQVKDDEMMQGMRNT